MGLKKRLSKVSPLTIGAVVLFAGLMTYFLFNAFAASSNATLYTSPSGTKAVTTGQNFTVSVRVSTPSGAPVTGASVYLSYPSSLVQVVSESYSGSAYNTQLLVSNSGGVLRMDRAAFPQVSGGDQLFAQVTFKALATGSASIGFTSSSIVTSGVDDSNILSQRNGVTYNISAPAPPPSSGGGSSGGGSSSGSGSSGSGSSGSSSGGTTGPSAPSTSGSGSSGGQSASGGGSTGSTTPKSSGGSTGSTPSTSSSGASTSSTSEVSTVQITVIDSGNKPVEGAEVTIGNQTSKTNKNGVASFNNVPSGDQDIAVQYNGKKTAKTVQVKGAQSPETFKVSIVRNKFNPAVLLLPIIILVLVGGGLMRPWERFVRASIPGQIDADKVVTSDNHPSATIQPTPFRQTVSPNKPEVQKPAEPQAPTPQPPVSPAIHKTDQQPGAVYSPDSSDDSSDSQPPKPE